MVSATFKSSGVPGLVSSFITFGNNEDEIDVEIGGGDSTNVQFNWYGCTPGQRVAHILNYATRYWHGIKELNAKGMRVACTFPVQTTLTSAGASLHGHIVNTPLDNSENYYTYTVHALVWRAPVDACAHRLTADRLERRAHHLVHQRCRAVHRDSG